MENLTTTPALPALPRPEKSPWQIRNPKNTRSMILASVLPALAALAITYAFNIDGTIAMLTIFLPIQFAAAAFVGFKIFGRKGVADAGLVIYTIFFSKLQQEWGLLSFGCSLLVVAIEILVLLVPTLFVCSICKSGCRL